MDKANKDNRHVYWNPYFGGFLLGLLIIFTFYMTGRGLGASGAMKSSVVTLVDKVSHEHTINNGYYSKFVKDGESPMNTWLVKVLGFWQEPLFPVQFPDELGLGYNIHLKSPHEDGWSSPWVVESSLGSVPR